MSDTPSSQNDLIDEDNDSNRETADIVEHDSEISDETPQIVTDIGLLPDHPSVSQMETYVRIGPQKAPNCIECDDKNIQFPRSVLQLKLQNGEITSRDWIAFSPSKYSFYCFPCRIYYSEVIKSVSTPSTFIKSDGVDKQVGWLNIGMKLREHENSSSHKKCYLQWRELECRLSTSQGVDSLLSEQFKGEVHRWRQLLRRILDVTLSLAERGLPFQGSNFHIGDVHNGNFLGLIELLARYDPLLQDHVDKIREPQSGGTPMKVHYLSHATQNEFIKLCSDEVRKKVLQERNDAKYYSVIVDATPDVSHDEQHTFILRHLVLHGDKYSIQERFLGFVEESAKTGEGISQMMLGELKRHSIPIEDCRGQGYDNASNMSGRFKGVQQRIKDHNSLAVYSPCANHSLNLIGTDAVKSTIEFITFFGTVQSVYVLFSSSPGRWKILQKHIGCSLHAMSGMVKIICFLCLVLELIS